MTMWGYLTESGLWSIAGLIVGYGLGRMERAVFQIKKKVDPDDHT